VRDATGEVYRIAGIAEDITERKRVEQQLSANAAALVRSNAEISRINAFLDSIVENIPDMLFVKDAETLRFERINRAGEELLGAHRDALLGKTDYELFPREEADFFVAKDREVLSSKKLLDIPEEIIQTKQGERVLHTKKIPIADEQGGLRYLLGISEDITTRKRAEEALREREEQLHRAVVEAPFPMMIHAEDGEVRLISRAWTDLSGYRLEEIPTVTRWTELAYGQRKELVDQDIERLYGLGERVDEGEYEIKTNRGDSRTWHFSSAPLGTLPDGRRMVISMAMDVTERKQAKEALAEHGRELARSNAELEQFAYVASHDLQEPLRMVASYVQLLQRRYKGRLDADADEFIRFAVDGATRMQRLINDLLAYSQVGTTGKRFAPTACDDVLDEVLANMATTIGEVGATVVREKLPTVPADRTQLVQLFQNLIGNAVKFRSDEPPTVHVSACKRGTDWVFAVRDNGVGIDERHRERIFAIFQRLHGRAEYPGMGIGLALCRKIVERHKGRIWVESHVGKGSVFCFTIPQHAGAS
jgi:PAS domain S-box-containing protein